MLITKDMGIMEIVQKYPATVEVLQRFGMGCIGCAAAHFENIEQGALAHGIDVPRLMEALKSIPYEDYLVFEYRSQPPENAAKVGLDYIRTLM